MSLRMNSFEFLKHEKRINFILENYKNDYSMPCWQAVHGGLFIAAAIRASWADVNGLLLVEGDLEEDAGFLTEVFFAGFFAEGFFESFSAPPFSFFESPGVFSSSQHVFITVLHFFFGDSDSDADSSFSFSCFVFFRSSSFSLSSSFSSFSFSSFSFSSPFLSSFSGDSGLSDCLFPPQQPQPPQPPHPQTLDERARLISF